MGFVVPRYIDSRPLVLPADNQGNTPMCAAYSMAGIVECKEWQRTGIQTTVNPEPIYKEAKRLDADGQDGTTLERVIEVAKSARIVPTDVKVLEVTGWIDMQFALHRYDVVLCGFMVDEGWMNASKRTGFVGDSNNQLGGHAVVAVYSDDQSIGFINSWGTDWGVNGYGRVTRRQFDKSFVYGKVLAWNP